MQQYTAILNRILNSKQEKVATRKETVVNYDPHPHIKYEVTV